MFPNMNVKKESKKPSYYKNVNKISALHAGVDVNS